jgi:hypothetical protein
MNQIWLMLGLKPEGFRGGMKKAIDDTKEFERGWKGLAKVFAAGGITTLILGFLRNMAAEAQKTRGEMEKLGQPIPQGVTALATLGDAFDGLGKIAGVTVGTILSGWKMLFDEAGSIINRIRGIGEAQENASQAAARGVKEQEAALAKARAENSPEKIHAAEKDLAAFRRKAAIDGLDGEAKMSALLQENLRLRQLAGSTAKNTLVGIQAEKDLAQNIVDIQKLNTQLVKDRAEAQKKSNADQEQAAKHLADEHDRLAKAKFEGLTIDKQIETLDQSRAILEGNIVAMKHAGIDTTTEEADLQEILNTLAEKRKTLTEQTAEAETHIKKTMDGEAEAARRTQLIREASIFGMTNGGASAEDIQQANDQALQDKIRRNNGALLTLRQNPGSAFNIGDGFNILKLENENKRLQSELDLRNGLRNDISFMGVEGARRQFKGDPLIFDKLVEQFSNRTDEAKETNDLLRDIRSHMRPPTPELQRIGNLLEKGIPTVIQGTTG